MLRNDTNPNSLLNKKELVKSEYKERINWLINWCFQQYFSSITVASSLKECFLECYGTNVYTAIVSQFERKFSDLGTKKTSSSANNGVFRFFIPFSLDSWRKLLICFLDLDLFCGREYNMTLIMFYLAFRLLEKILVLHNPWMPSIITFWIMLQYIPNHNDIIMSIISNKLFSKC